MGVSAGRDPLCPSEREPTLSPFCHYSCCACSSLHEWSGRGERGWGAGVVRLCQSTSTQQSPHVFCRSRTNAVSRDVTTGDMPVPCVWQGHSHCSSSGNVALLGITRLGGEREWVHSRSVCWPFLPLGQGVSVQILQSLL